jgi:hypothetical protein
MTAYNAGRAWRHSPYVAFVDDGERIVLVNLAALCEVRPTLFEGSSAALWRAIDGTRSPSEVASIASHEFDVQNTSVNLQEESLQADVMRFLISLRSEGLADEVADDDDARQPRPK